MTARSLVRATVRGSSAGGVGGGPSSYSPEAGTLIAAMTTRPSEDRIALIDALIEGLKTDGLWTKLDAFWILAAHDSQAGKLNWKTPGTYTLTESGTGTWTTDRGWAGNGTDGRLTTGAAPSAMTQFQLNSATAFLWSRTAAALAAPSMGLALNATFQMHPRFTGDTFSYRLNDGTGVTTANADGSGFYAGSRTSSTTSQGYKNGAAIGSAGAVTSTSRSANSIVLGGNVTSYTTMQIASAGIGSSLDATQHANLYTRLNTFMTAIGAA